MSVRKPQMSSVCSFVRLHDRHFKAVHFIRNVKEEEEEEGKKKLMAWIEVYGGQRSLAFEVTTAVNLSRANF